MSLTFVTNIGRQDIFKLTGRSLPDRLGLSDGLLGDYREMVAENP